MLALYRLAMTESAKLCLFLAALAITTPLGLSQEVVEQQDADYLENDYYESEEPIEVYPGWPAGISCHEACTDCHLTYDEYVDDDFYYPGDDMDVQCQISIDDDVLFNATIAWGEGYQHGIFDVASSNWVGASIRVSVTWYDDLGPRDLTRETIIEQSNATCDDSTNSKDIIVNESNELQCMGPSAFNLLSEEQYNQIETVWYRNGERIDANNKDYEYIARPYGEEEELEFDSLKVKNASLTSTPGLFQCTLEFNSQEICVYNQRICLTKKYEYANEPTIIGSTELLEVEPGERAELRCSGQTGTDSDSISQHVTWTKQGTELCYTSHHPDNSDPKCTLEVHENLQYCEPLSVEEASDIPNHRLDDNFTTIYTIENATSEDAGVYTCTFSSTRGQPQFNIMLVVREKPTTHNILTIVLIVVGVFIAIALIILLLIHIFLLRIQFYVKKVFGKKHELYIGHVAFLVYAPDAFKNKDENAVKDVTDWFETMKYPSYDPNRAGDGNNNDDMLLPNNNDAGKCHASHLEDILRKCLTMVIIVTEELLNKNELEIFRTFKGLQHNAQRALKLVFICTRDIEKAVKAAARGASKGAKYNHNTCLTIRSFMQLPRNRVIRWKPENHTHLNRALYVAIPKVKHRQGPATIA